MVLYRVNCSDYQLSRSNRSAKNRLLPVWGPPERAPLPRRGTRPYDSVEVPWRLGEDREHHHLEEKDLTPTWETGPFERTSIYVNCLAIGASLYIRRLAYTLEHSWDNCQLSKTTSVEWRFWLICRSIIESYHSQLRKWFKTQMARSGRINCKRLWRGAMDTSKLQIQIAFWMSFSHMGLSCIFGAE